jgi:hypothetical protein
MSHDNTVNDAAQTHGQERGDVGQHAMPCPQGEQAKPWTIRLSVYGIGLVIVYWEMVQGIWRIVASRFT